MDENATGRLCDSQEGDATFFQNHRVHSITNLRTFTSHKAYIDIKSSVKTSDIDIKLLNLTFTSLGRDERKHTGQRKPPVMSTAP
jgi:hypothetical protein